MKPDITLTEDQLLELFSFMEEANDIFHQQMKYQDSKLVEAFVSKHYKTIHKYYYDVLWEKLPDQIKNEILNQ